MAIHPWPVTEPAKGSAVQPSWSELSHKKAGETETAGMRSSFQDTLLWSLQGSSAHCREAEWVSLRCSGEAGPGGIIQCTLL